MKQAAPDSRGLRRVLRTGRQAAKCHPVPPAVRPDQGLVAVTALEQLTCLMRSVPHSVTSNGQEEPSEKSPHKAPPLSALSGRFSLQVRH